MNPQLSNKRRCTACRVIKGVGAFSTPRICSACMSDASTQRCRKCKVEKLLTDFHKSKVRRRGRASDCKACRAKRSKAIWSDPKLRKVASKRTKAWVVSQAGQYRIFERNLIREYGIDLEDWARIFNKQEGRCACCDRALRLDRTTHVDHCHGSGAVRSLLCQWCNSIIGYANDDANRLQMAIDYLVRFK